MGTRSLTFVYDKEVPVLCLYRQFDGYPSGMGLDLANFLNSFDEITNGFKLNEKRKIANGIGCLAAQLVKEMKNGHGSVYLMSTFTTDAGQDYEYHIYEKRIIVKNYNEQVIFSGNKEQFLEFCKEDET